MRLGGLSVPEGVTGNGRLAKDSERWAEFLGRGMRRVLGEEHISEPSRNWPLGWFSVVSKASDRPQAP